MVCSVIPCKLMAKALISRGCSFCSQDQTLKSSIVGEQAKFN